MRENFKDAFEAEDRSSLLSFRLSNILASLDSAPLNIVPGVVISTREKLSSLSSSVRDFIDNMMTVKDISAMKGLSTEKLEMLQRQVSSGHLLGVESELMEIKNSAEPESWEYHQADMLRSSWELILVKQGAAERNINIYGKEDIEAISEIFPSVSADGRVFISRTNLSELEDKKKVEDVFARAYNGELQVKEATLTHKEKSLFEESIENDISETKTP